MVNNLGNDFIRKNQEHEGNCNISHRTKYVSIIFALNITRHISLFSETELDRQLYELLIQLRS